jgi:PTH1 family peptidyl-tRNA hydrolase
VKYPLGYLVLGLGNPGREFKGTRHNIGKTAVETYADMLGLELKRSKNLSAKICVLDRYSNKVLLAVPQVYMNESGISLKKILNQYELRNAADNFIVVHDEMDLEPGRIKVKLNGGTAGHNGIASLIDMLGSKDFIRIRIGIGKPKSNGSDFVLSPFDYSELPLVKESIAKSHGAIDTIISSGLSEAMEKYNSKKL